jgi:hypothetical protein
LGRKTPPAVASPSRPLPPSSSSFTRSLTPTLALLLSLKLEIFTGTLFILPLATPFENDEDLELGLDSSGPYIAVFRTLSLFLTRSSKSIDFRRAAAVATSNNRTDPGAKGLSSPGNEVDNGREIESGLGETNGRDRGEGKASTPLGVTEFEWVEKGSSL